MSERDEMAKLLFITDNFDAADAEHEWEMLSRHSPEYTKYVIYMADAIIAAGYRKPRTITTAEDVSSMAFDSIVRTHGGVPLELWEGENEDREWRVTGHRPWTDAELTKNLPAAVLWEPQP